MFLFGFIQAPNIVSRTSLKVRDILNRLENFQCLFDRIVQRKRNHCRQSDTKLQYRRLCYGFVVNYNFNVDFFKINQKFYKIRQANRNCIWLECSRCVTLKIELILINSMCHLYFALSFSRLYRTTFSRLRMLISKCHRHHMVESNVKSPLFIVALIFSFPRTLIHCTAYGYELNATCYYRIH